MKYKCCMVFLIFGCLSGCMDSSQTATSIENPPYPIAVALAKSAVSAIKNPQLAVKAKYDLMLDSIVSPIDLPSGKFVLQVSSYFSKTDHFKDGQTTAFLQIYRPGAPNELLLIGAKFDASIDGFRAVVENGGFFGGGSYGTPVSFPSVHQLDLKIEQTATQLIFSTRATTRPASGDWTTLYTLNNPPNSQGYTPSIGVNNLSKKGKLYFDNLCVDVEHIGGDAEEPSILAMQQAYKALYEAQQALTAATVDIAVASAKLAIVINTLDSTISDTNTALLANSFETATYGKKALSAMTKTNKALVKIQTKLATLTPSKAKNQGKTLTPLIANLMSATSNLLGYKVAASTYSKYLGIISLECAIAN